MIDDSGFVTILNGEDRVVSNPAGTAPEYIDGKLQLMVQELPIFYEDSSGYTATFTYAKLQEYSNRLSNLLKN